MLPSSDGQRGRPFRDHRQVVEGIVYRYRCGIAWRDLPTAFGPWQTAAMYLALAAAWSARNCGSWRYRREWSRLQGRHTHVPSLAQEPLSVFIACPRAQVRLPGRRNGLAPFCMCPGLTQALRPQAIRRISSCVRDPSPSACCRASQAYRRGVTEDRPFDKPKRPEAVQTQQPVPSSLPASLSTFS